MDRLSVILFGHGAVAWVCSGLFWSRHMLRTRDLGAWRMTMNSTERSHKP